MEFFNKYKPVILVVLGILIFIAVFLVALQLFSYYIWVQKQGALPFVPVFLS